MDCPAVVITSKNEEAHISFNLIFLHAVSNEFHMFILADLGVFVWQYTQDALAEKKIEPQGSIFRAGRLALRLRPQWHTRTSQASIAIVVKRVIIADL